MKGHYSHLYPKSTSKLKIKVMSSFERSVKLIAWRNTDVVFGAVPVIGKCFIFTVCRQAEFGDSIRKWLACQFVGDVTKFMEGAVSTVFDIVMRLSRYQRQVYLDTCDVTLYVAWFTMCRALCHWTCSDAMLLILNCQKPVWVIFLAAIEWLPMKQPLRICQNVQ